MLDAVKLRNVVKEVNPDYVVPEIEAIRTEELLKLEKSKALILSHQQRL